MEQRHIYYLDGFFLFLVFSTSSLNGVCECMYLYSFLCENQQELIVNLVSVRHFVSAVSLWTPMCATNRWRQQVLPPFQVPMEPLEDVLKDKFPDTQLTPTGI